MKKKYFFLTLCFIGLICCQTKYTRNDAEFNKSSKIDSVKLPTSKTDDLVILGKIWGFLKYYHPNIAKGEYNWDYELFRIMPEIINCRDNNERNNIISKWIKTFGEFELREVGILDSTKTKIKPDLAWISDQSLLGRKLSNQLIHIQNAKRTSNYYVSFVSDVGNPDFKNELSYYKIKNPDVGFRLLSLFRYWNIIQYYYPYKNLIKENWNDILNEFIPKFVNATGELNYKLIVLELIARVHDTHATIWGNDEMLQTYKGNNFAPIEVKFVENKAVVTDYLNKPLGENSGLQKGDIITNINHKKIDEIIKEKLLITCASNYPTQLRNIAYNLLRTNDSLLEITYQREKSVSNLKLKCFSQKIISNIYGKYSRKDTCFRFIREDISYIHPGNIKNEYLPEIMKESQKTKGLIVDMRYYPSEFIVFTLGEYFMPEPIDFVRISTTSVESPGLFTFMDAEKVGRSNKDYYKGKIVILINEITQSQAEFTTMAFRVAPKAIVIGSTTAGTDGNVSFFYLPGGIKTAISGIGIYYPDGRETQRIGIVPDIEVKPTIKGILDGKDELLEKAIKIINEK
jgi:C-terminal processing protease CtpA/Prc